MTEPISRKMAVDCLLNWLVINNVIIRCSICEQPLLPGQDIQFDHMHASVFGGPHEYRNLRPIHYDPCHKSKTKKDVQANAKVRRLQAGGRKRRGPKIKSKPFAKRCNCDASCGENRYHWLGSPGCKYEGKKDASA